MVLEKVETQSLGNSVGSSCLQNHHPKHAFSDFGKMEFQLMPLKLEIQITNGITKLKNVEGKDILLIVQLPGPGSRWQFCRHPRHLGTSLVAQRLKRLSAMRETWVRSLGQEDTLEKEMAIHSSILAWKIPWMEEPGGLQSTGLRRVRH